MVAHHDLRRRGRRFGMDHGGIRHPRFASALEMFLHTPPFVPSEEAVETDENERKKDDNNDANLSGLDEVSSDIVNNRRIKVLTK